jgi:hypothetical protein
MEWMTKEERKEYQEEETSHDDLGTALIVIGAIFFMYDGFLLLFLGWDVRAGSDFFVIWEITQAIAGAGMIALGTVINMKAHTKDNV